MSREFEILRDIVRKRRTEKVIAAVDQPITYPPQILIHWNAVVAESVATAGMAPFHYDRGVDSIPEPWRVHFLDMSTCRSLARSLGNWFELKPSNKLPGMLSACGCLLMVTWLPQFRSSRPLDETESAEKGTEIDDEHLAAAAALVQNLLLLLTAAGLGTYWSSGGVLGGREVFERLGVGQHERLLAAVFVEYPAGTGSIPERVAGKNRSLRCPPELWYSEIKLRDQSK